MLLNHFEAFGLLLFRLRSLRNRLFEFGHCSWGIPLVFIGVTSILRLWQFDRDLRNEREELSFWANDWVGRELGFGQVVRTAVGAVEVYAGQAWRKVIYTPHLVILVTVLLIAEVWCFIDAWRSS